MSETEPSRAELVPGDLLTHYTGGAYRVTKIVLNASGYERDGDRVVKPVAEYVQLYDGDYPTGTEWTRPVDEILSGTASIDGQEVRIFEVTHAGSDTE